MNLGHKKGDILSEHMKEFEEMYLKTLYEFHISDPEQPIRTSALAEAMNVSAAAASEMVQRLAGRGLLDYERYKGAHLTQAGLEASASIKRREGLMEVFLVRMLDYRGDVKAASCRLEHALTDDLEATIDRLLGYPERTPEGDTIPPVMRKIEPIANSMLLPLRALPEGMSGRIEMIVLDGADIRTMNDTGIVNGATIRSTGEGFELDNHLLEISSSLASRILVRTI